jgi:hypothetical protein
MGQLEASSLPAAKAGISWDASWRHSWASDNKVAGGAREARRASMESRSEFTQFAV